MSSNLAELERFQQEVLNDLNLQQQLRDATDKESFLELVMSLSQQRGYRITALEVDDAMRAALRTWIERWTD
jgi:acetolactate synthase regulatory subunit